MDTCQILMNILKASPPVLCIRLSLFVVTQIASSWVVQFYQSSTYIFNWSLVEGETKWVDWCSNHLVVKKWGNGIVQMLNFDQLTNFFNVNRSIILSPHKFKIFEINAAINQRLYRYKTISSPKHLIFWGKK